MNDTTNSEDPLPAAVRDTTRGRDATHPREFPWPAWKDIALRLKREISEDNLSLIAAGVAFYGLLALFPILAALASIWGLFADGQRLLAMVDVLETVLSPGAADILAQRLAQLQVVDDQQLTWTIVGGLAVSLWSARRGMNAMMIAHNVVYEEREERGLFVRIVVSLLLTIATLVLMMVLLGAIVFAGMLPDLTGFHPWIERLLQLLVWAGVAVLFSLSLAGLYRFAPSRENARWQWVTSGAALATGLWMLASIGFSIYVENFANYDETYGTLGGVVVLLMWFWVSAWVVLLGAEVNAELEHQTGRDTTVGPEEPLGERGAYVADTLGATAPEIRHGVDRGDPDQNSDAPRVADDRS